MISADSALRPPPRATPRPRLRDGGGPRTSTPEPKRPSPRRGGGLEPGGGQEGGGRSFEPSPAGSFFLASPRRHSSGVLFLGTPPSRRPSLRQRSRLVRAELELGAPRENSKRSLRIRQLLQPPPVAMLLDQPPCLGQRRAVVEQPAPIERNVRQVQRRRTPVRDLLRLVQIGAGGGGIALAGEKPGTGEEAQGEIVALPRVADAVHGRLDLRSRGGEI